MVVTKKLDVTTLLLNMTIIMLVPTTIVPPDMVLPIPLYNVTITTLALTIGVIILRDVNTINTTVMTITLVPMTLVMKKLGALIFLFQLMITMNALMIIVAQLKEFTTLINQFLPTTPV